MKTSYNKIHYESRFQFKKVQFKVQRLVQKDLSGATSEENKKDFLNLGIQTQKKSLMTGD